MLFDLELTRKRYVYIRISFKEMLFFFFFFFSTLALWKLLLCSANINFTGIKRIQNFTAVFRSPSFKRSRQCHHQTDRLLAAAASALSEVKRPHV